MKDKTIFLMKIRITFSLKRQISNYYWRPVQDSKLRARTALLLESRTGILLEAGCNSYWGRSRILSEWMQGRDVSRGHAGFYCWPEQDSFGFLVSILAKRKFFVE